MNANENKSFYYSIDTDISAGDLIYVGDYTYTIDAQADICGVDCENMYVISETDETVLRKIEHLDSPNV